MAKEELIETRFHALPIQNNKALPIDVGGCPIFDISVNNFGQNFVNTRKVPISQESCITPFGVALPLTLPKTSYFSADYNINRTFCYPIKEGIHVRLAHQYEWYIKNRVDVQHLGIRDGLGRHSKEWKSLKHIFSSHRERFQFRNIDRATRKRSHDKIIEHDAIIYECCNDIPQKLILSMLDESCYKDYIDYTENNSLRNCVCAYRDGHVLHTSGPYNNELVLVKLTTNSRLLDCFECDRVDVGEKILEIECLDCMIVIRCYYSLVFYESLEEENVLKLKETNRLYFDTTIHGSAVHQFTKDEVVVVDMQSVVILSLDGQVLQSVKNDTSELDEPPKWQNITHSNSIQTYLLSRSSEILMHDFREKPYNMQTFFDLPSEYFNRYELFSPILSSSPITCHQYFASTNQSLIVIDDRYLKTPVMKINHYMDTPPRFIQTYKKHSQDGCFVALGAYEKDEIVAMNLQCGHTQEVSLDNNNDVKFKFITPLQMDGNLVQFSTPSYWSTKLNDWRLAYKKITNRLDQPCIGFCINETESDHHGLYVVQESLPGDLYYQRFFIQRESVKRENIEHQRLYKTLCSDGESRCKSWVDSMWEIYEQDKSGKEDPSGSVYLDINDLEAKLLNDKDSTEGNTGEVLSSAEESDTPNSNSRTVESKSDVGLVSGQNIGTCSLPGAYVSSSSTFDNLDMLESNLSNSSADEEKVASESIDDSTIWRRLVNLRNGNKIVTRTSMELPVRNFKDLNLVSSPETFEKPLSKTLLKNWTEDQYTPLEFFAPYIANDDEGDGNGGVLDVKPEDAGV